MLIKNIFQETFRERIGGQIAEMIELSKNAARIELQHHPKLQKNFKISNIEKIIHARMKRRAMRADEVIGLFIVQCLISNTVIIVEPLIPDVIFTHALKLQFNNIEILISNNCNLPPQLFTTCLDVFPRLRVINIQLMKLDESNIEYLRSQSKTLEELRLGLSEDFNNLTNVFFCRLFFSKRGLKEIEECFKSGEDANVSFPHLKYLSLPIFNSDFKPFIQLFLHYYPQTHMETIDEKVVTPVSVFDSYLAHTIDLYPEHALRHCSLRYEDLRFPYVEEITTKWVNLTMLNLTISDFTVDVDAKRCAQTLAAIMSSSKKLNKFHLCLSTNEPEPYLSSLHEVFRTHSKNLRHLSLLDRCTYLTQKELTKILNCFLALESLQIVFKYQLNYSITPRLKRMKNLKYLSVFVTNSSHFFTVKENGAKIVCDLICQSPNLTSLNIYVDTYICNELEKLTLPSTLRRLSFNFLTLRLPDMENIMTALKASKVDELLFFSESEELDGAIRFLFLVMKKSFPYATFDVFFHEPFYNTFPDDRIELFESKDKNKVVVF